VHLNLERTLFFLGLEFSCYLQALLCLSKRPAARATHFLDMSHRRVKAVGFEGDYDDDEYEEYEEEEGEEGGNGTDSSLFHQLYMY
jgi:hypothetical protein